LPPYRLARLTELDLRSIIRYTMKTWGTDQARRYSRGLLDCFELLAKNPSLGRRCDAIRHGLQRFEFGKHVVFYLSQPDGILIVRVLHQRMLPAKSRFET